MYIKDALITLGLLILLTYPFFTVHAYEDTKVIMYGFTDCSSCLNYMGELGDALEDKGIKNIQIRSLEDDPEAIKELYDLNDQLDIPLSMQGSVTVVIDDRFIFEGYVPIIIIIDFIENYKDETIEGFVLYRIEYNDQYRFMNEKGEITECIIKNSINECISKKNSILLSLPILPLVVVSGLLDGINPCAFAVLLFFITFLLAMERAIPIKNKRIRIIKVGSIYITSIYIGYFLIGVGILKIATLSPIPNLAAWIGATLVIILGAINIKDYFFYGRGFSLKISSNHWPIITKLIHKATIPSACIVGFLVAFFEFPCTGGIYIAILGMLASKTAKLEALTYLSIYNFAFILPLIVILVFMSSSQLVEKMKKWQIERKSYFKLFSGLTMIAIGILIFLWTL